MIERVRSVILEVKETDRKRNAVVGCRSFQTNLAQFEKDLKAQMEAGRPAASTFEVTDATSGHAVELLWTA